MKTETTELMNRFSGQVRGIPENAEETRTIPFVISDDSKDRHGSRLNMDNWSLDAFRANGIVGYQHDVYGGDMCRKADPDDVIGNAEPYFTNIDGKKVLMADVTFETKDVNERADKIFRKVLAGTLKATSVGFIPLKDEDGKTGRYGYVDKNGDVQDKDTFFYYGQELVELSVVNIPSNRNALQRNLRDYAGNALKFLKRELGFDYTYGDIEQMRVVDVIDMLERPGHKPEKKDRKIDIKHKENDILSINGQDFSYGFFNAITNLNEGESLRFFMDEGMLMAENEKEHQSDEEALPKRERLLKYKQKTEELIQ